MHYHMTDKCKDSYVRNILISMELFSEYLFQDIVLLHTSVICCVLETKRIKILKKTFNYSCPFTGMKQW
jgi:hypothetical protein